jgi:phage-related baseplate assembly protein
MPVIVPQNSVPSVTGVANAVPFNLPLPLFVNDADGLNPLAVLDDMITSFETTSGKTLYPAQLEQLLINLYAYRESLVRNAIQYAGMQNLVAFASYPALDYLGQLLDVTRLPAQSSSVTLQFVLTGIQLTPTTIPAGTQVGTTDGTFIFSTAQDLVIPAGAFSGFGSASCTTPGAIGNGYVAGQVSVLVSVLPLVSTVTNTTTSIGGTDGEIPGVTGDNLFRSRIQIAPGALTVAGPVNSYKSFARAVSAAVIDVQIPSPPATPGTVQVYILSGPVTVPAAYPNFSGIASAALINQVAQALSASTVRPLCDTVQVAAVTEVDYVVTATITLYANANYGSTYAGIVAAAQALALLLASSIGQDIVPNQWITALSVSGVYDIAVSITAQIGATPLVPGPDGSFVLANGQWANATAINLTVIFGSKNQPLS